MRKMKVGTGKPALTFSIREAVTVMPRFPDHPCRHPGCPKLVPKGQKYCDEHASLPPEEVRSAAARCYGSRWRRLSKSFLRAHPLCAQCQREGKYVKATVVDHICPHRGDPVLFWDQSNLQPLCKHHHDVETRNEDQHPVYHY